MASLRALHRLGEAADRQQLPTRREQGAT